MGDLVNLRRFRKAKVRDAAVQTAAANRARFGATKGEKRTAADETDRIARTLDQAKRET